MKNKKLWIILTSLVLCLCILVPVGIRLAWCKVTFVCKEGCEHTAWCWRWGEADATVVLEAHKEEQKGKAMGALYFDPECLLSYLGEPVRKARLTLYIDEWKYTSLFTKVTLETPYGMLLYHMTAGDLSELEERIPAALRAQGGSADAQYVYYLKYNHSQRESECEDLPYLIWVMRERMSPSPEAAVATTYTDIYTGQVYYEFYIRVVPLEEADTTQS